MAVYRIRRDRATGTFFLAETPEDNETPPPNPVTGLTLNQALDTVRTRVQAAPGVVFQVDIRVLQR